MKNVLFGNRNQKYHCVVYLLIDINSYEFHIYRLFIMIQFYFVYIIIATDIILYM